MFRKLSLYLIVSLCVLLVSGCGATSTSAPTPPATDTPDPTPTAADVMQATVPPTPASTTSITDAAGRTITLAGAPERIVSLAPSNTEILFALDLGPQVVAVDDFSDFPEAVKELPKVGGSNGTYNVEQIVALKPDLILVAGITPAEVVKQLEMLKLPVAVASVTELSFENILSSIVLVGQMTDRVDKATQMTKAMQQKFDRLKDKLANATTKPRVYWEIDATDPTKPFTIGPGNFIDDMIRFANATNIFSDASSIYPQVSAEQVVAADPNIIILANAAYGVTVDSVLERPGWSVIDAVKNRRVYPIDSNLVSRPGPRIVDGFEEVAKLLHPELFP